MFPLELWYTVTDYLTHAQVQHLRRTNRFLYCALDSDTYWKHRSLHTKTSAQAQFIAQTISWRYVLTPKPNNVLYQHQSLSWDVTDNVWIQLDNTRINVSAHDIDKVIHLQHKYNATFLLFINSKKQLRALFVNSQAQRNLLVREEVANAHICSDVIIIVSTQGKIYYFYKSTDTLIMCFTRDVLCPDDIFFRNTNETYMFESCAQFLVSVIAHRVAFAIDIYVLTKEKKLYYSRDGKHLVLVSDDVQSLHKHDDIIIITKHNKVMLRSRDDNLTMWVKEIVTTPILLHNIPFHIHEGELSNTY